MINFSEIRILLLAASMITLNACEFLFGTRNDEQVGEIFEQGAIDPNLIPDQTGYVPLLPFWNGIDEPQDIYVGYDEMVYVITNNGLEVFDQKGERQNIIYIPQASDVIQDRRLHTYVAGRIEQVIDGVTYSLPAVYHLMNTFTASEVAFIDTLIHPYCDVSRNNTAFRGADDEAVLFTGLATLHDNTLYVSRSGPINNLSSVARPDRTILLFDESGTNTGYTVGLNPVTSSLKSVLDVGSIATFAAPPQSVTGISSSRDFLLLQTNEAAQYKALWIVQEEDPETGSVYSENASLLNFDTSKASGFLYTPERFKTPSDIYVAPDFSGYIFITDTGTDSLYVFTREGLEGVNPPAISNSTRQVLASFGGTGTAPFQFNDPAGVCYFEKIVYVADRFNNRICRYILSTDLE